ncbi:lipocalin family protein [Sulfitobacter sp. PS-8MA]|uniref:lipocalin family protein n=1 Tax=Sulfitobacter sp. PS-8MA TaxID=3237707 RepID=UPI0034C5EF18
MGRPWSQRARQTLALVLLGTLAACNTAPPQEGFRDPAALIGATSRYDAARFAGDWQVRAAFPGDGDLQAVRFARQGPSFVEHRQSCDATGLCAPRRVLWEASEQGPGRYKLRARQGGAEKALWVLWVDEGFRTAVIGAPDGRYGWILDREASGGADRIAAAQQILDFNGYDIGALQIRR